MKDEATKTNLSKMKSQLKSLAKKEEEEFVVSFKFPSRWQKSSSFKYIGISVSLVLTFIGLVLMFFNINSFDKTIAEAKEIGRPANLEIIKLIVDDCENCFDLENAVEDLKNQNVKFVKEKLVSAGSEEGLEIVKQYGIRKVPTYIVTGELKKSESLEIYWSRTGEYTDEKENAVVFSNILPVYFDTENEVLKGEVTVKYIAAAECKQCTDLEPFIENYKNAGIKIISESTVSWDSAAGKALIKKHGIKRVPTFILNKEASEYENILKSWESMGIRSGDDFVLTELNPPYFDVSSKTLKGLVDIVILTDSTCTECFDPAINENIIINNFKVALDSRKSIDINSKQGRDLVTKYNIEKVPTILLSPEASSYKSLMNVWNSVGTKEMNGWYVFRSPEKLGKVTYRNIKTGEIVIPQEATQ